MDPGSRQSKNAAGALEAFGRGPVRTRVKFDSPRPRPGCRKALAAMASKIIKAAWRVIDKRGPNRDDRANLGALEVKRRVPGRLRKMARRACPTA
jgi:hypothetical protein